jgi:hypothetical protein
MSLKETILIDDETYYIALDSNFAEANAPGYLKKRCAANARAPAGCECIGSFRLGVAGKWESEISTGFDPASEHDVRGLGTEISRISAIANLWQARHEAQCHAC